MESRRHPRQDFHQLLTRKARAAMSDAWLSSLLCRPPKILGRRLQPFSLAHSFILERAENPYWCGGDKTAAHFFEAVDICARALDENAAHFNGGKVRTFKKWAAKFLRKVNAEEVIAFTSYLNNFAECPPRDNKGGGRAMVSPWQFRIVGWLVAHGFAEDRAWNMPLNLAMCYFGAANEMEGDESLIEQWREDAYEMIARGNELELAGNKEEAEALYAKAQGIFNERNGATKNLETLTT